MRDPFSVRYTRRALRHMREKVDYIRFELCEPDLAEAWITRIHQEITGTLPSFPFMYPQCTDASLQARGVRQFTFRSDIILYTVEEERRMIFIEAVLSKGRDLSRLWETEGPFPQKDTP